MKCPKVYFSERALKQITAEVSRWYGKGIRETGKPFEAVGFPLSYIKLARGITKGPVEIISSQDIDLLVVTHIAIPQDKVKNYSANHANFRKDGIDVEKCSRIFLEKKVSPLIRRFPLLEIISRLHSHPFPSGKFHSLGDKFTFHRDEIDVFGKGIGVSFSFIMTPKKESGNELEWDLTGFMVDGIGKEKRLTIEIVDENHPLIREAKQQPYYKQKEGISFERGIRKIGEEFVCFREQIFSRGWKSFWFKNSENEIIFLIPPFFPQERLRIFLSENGKSFQEICETKSGDTLYGSEFKLPMEYIRTALKEELPDGCTNAVVSESYLASGG
jgi:hypothetical protein